MENTDSNDAVEHLGSSEDSMNFTLSNSELLVLNHGPKLKATRVEEGFQVVVNKEAFSSVQEALRTATLRLAQMRQFQVQMQRQAKEMLNMQGTNVMRALALTGLKNLRSESLELIEQLTREENGLSFVQQFDRAVEHYVLHGDYPNDLLSPIQSALDSLPKLKGGLALLDALTSERYTLSALAKMQERLMAARAQLKALDKQTTDQFTYKPQVCAGEAEPLDPESIETKVTPFYGGYYRGYVCRYDPQSHQIVQESSAGVRFEEDQSEGEHRRYAYETQFDPSKDNCLELPYKAFPFVQAIASSGFALFRTESGVWYLKSTNQHAEKVKVTFQFILADHPSLFLDDEPEEIEVWGRLDESATDFIESLRSQPHLSRVEKAKRTAAYVRKRFKYPGDESERGAMNQAYLASGDGALMSICQKQVTDCYWSNIFFGQLLARLGIDSRLIAGHYVQKDPRFDFAAIAGIGHAWSEVWDGQSWQRLDATPPKESEEEDEQQEEMEEQDGDFGEDAEPEEQEELSLDEIKDLFAELLKEQGEPSAEEKVDQLFEQRVGVSREKWKQVESFIRAVNETPVPASSSIKRCDSTIQEEWEALFELIYKRREIPVESFRGPVRQSEGQHLEDPVDATIDLMSGESDPMGFKLEARKKREEVHVTSFEDDSILDLTGSMSGLPAQEQKKMVLTGLYNLMNLSRRLNLDKYKNKMEDSIVLRSRLLSFKGDTQVFETLGSEDAIDEKALCRLYDELERTRTGVGNLAGALKAYELGLTPEVLDKIKHGQLIKVLTIVSDGAVANQSEATTIIQSVRDKGIVVQGIGFGDAAQDIRLICHDQARPDAGVVLSDVRDAVLTRHKFLVRSLSKLT